MDVTSYPEETKQNVIVVGCADGSLNVYKTNPFEYVGSFKKYHSSPITVVRFS